MADDDQYYFEDAQEPEYVMGFNEGQARGRAGALLGTVIEGARGSALMRAAQRLEMREEGTLIDRQFVAYFFSLRELFPRFSDNDEVALLNRFHELKHYEYKNVYATLLAFIFSYLVEENARRRSSGGELKQVMQIARSSGHEEITEEDVVRYYRLVTAHT